MAHVQILIPCVLGIVCSACFGGPQTLPGGTEGSLQEGGTTSVAATDGSTGTLDTSAAASCASSDTLSSSSSSSSSTGDSQSTGEPRREPTFADDFERPESATLGNGWIEKNAEKWRISNGRLVGPSESAFSFWQQHLWHRPAAEDARDIELAVEFVITAEDDLNSPALVARILPAGLSELQAFHGYMLSVDTAPDRSGQSTQLTIRRTRSNDEQQWPSVFFAEPLVAYEVYQLRFSVRGELPVELWGALYHRVQEQWELVGEVSHADGDNERIAIAGSWGGAGGETNQHIRNFVYDNFRAWID